MAWKTKSLYFIVYLYSVQNPLVQKDSMHYMAHPGCTSIAHLIPVTERKRLKDDHWGLEPNDRALPF